MLWEVKHWSFVCCENKQRIGPLFIVRCPILVLCLLWEDQYWSFVCCERSLLVLCLLWDDQYWSFVCKQRTNIGPFTTNRGPIMVLCLLWEVVIGPLFVVRGRYWSFVCCERSNIDLSQQTEDRYWPFTIVRGPITTSHNKQRTNVCCENKQRLLVITTFVCCEKTIIGPFTIVRGPILVLCLLWEVVNNLSQQTKDQCCETSHNWSFVWPVRINKLVQ